MILATDITGNAFTDLLTLGTIGLFTLAGLFGTYRVIKGPDLADRIIALDVTLMSAMGAIAVEAARADDPTDLVILIVIAIVGFTATVAASMFLEPDEKKPNRTGGRP